MEKVCNKCGVAQEETTEFYWRKDSGRYSPRCKTCVLKRQKAYVADNPARHRPSRMKLRFWRYKVTPEMFDAMVTEQNHSCGLCLEYIEDEKDFLIDHDHACCGDPHRNKSCGKCVRALICRTCNLGLGYFKDDPKKLELAIEYLGRY